MKRFTFLLILLSIICNSSYAQKTVKFYDGNDLNESFNRGGPPAFATGYVMGVVDARATGLIKCNLYGKQASQLVDIVKIYLQNNPESRDLPADTLVMKAIQEKMKC